MDCLVTGGAGFIGSNLVDALVDRGDSVTVIDNLSTGRRENLARALDRGANLHTVDIRDAAAVAAVFDATRPELVFHLAAQVDVRASVERPAEDAATNVVGTINVLDAARSRGAKRVINSSSGGAVYGQADLLPTPEDHPIRPLAPYGQSKYAAEGYCELYRRLYGLSTISLRYSNVYGPRQDTHGEAGVVAIFYGCLRAGRAPTVFGDGRQTRDWVEVSDVVRANLLAAETDQAGAVNVGRGGETSVLELLEALGDLERDAAGFDPQFLPPRPGEVMRSALDARAASTTLGWEAEVDLPQGLRRLVSGADEDE